MRISAPFVLMVTSLFLVGCGRRTTLVEQGNAEGVLHTAIGAEPESLDPALVTAYTTMQMQLAFFECLTAIDEATSKPVPASAKSWEVSADGLTWTFHLRSGLTWSDGQPITAHTFRDSWIRALSPTLGAEYAYVLHGIRHAAAFNAGEITAAEELGLKVPDDLTLVVELENPSPAFASILTLMIACPVPLHVLDAHGDRFARGNGWTRPENIVTNGPFVVAEWRPNQRIRASRNPLYRDADQVELNGVVFYPYENAVSQEAAFRAGQLHLTSEVPLAKIHQYRTHDPQLIRIDPFILTGFIRFNSTRPPLDDVRVRRALAMAIDRETLAANVLQGGESPAFRLTPPDTAGYTAVATIPHDPAAARQLLREAGFPDGQGFPNMEVMSRAREINQSILEVIQQMWRRELGIELQITMKEQRVWLDDETQLNFDLSNARWIGDYVEPSTFLELFLSNSGNNATGWGNSTYDTLIREAGTAADETARYERYQEAEAILLNDAVIAPLYHGTQAFLIRPEVRGWPPCLLGSHRYQNVSLSPGK